MNKFSEHFNVIHFGKLVLRCSLVIKNMFIDCFALMENLKNMSPIASSTNNPSLFFHPHRLISQEEF